MDISFVTLYLFERDPTVLFPSFSFPSTYLWPEGSFRGINSFFVSLSSVTFLVLLRRRFHPLLVFCHSRVFGSLLNQHSSVLISYYSSLYLFSSFSSWLFISDVNPSSSNVARNDPGGLYHHPWLEPNVVRLLVHPSLLLHFLHI